MKIKYESNVTISRRKYNEQRINDNLKLRIIFFKRNKRAPKKSDDKEEQRLYDFYRRIDLSKYDNIDQELIDENKKIDEYELAHAELYKKKKSFLTKQNYIFKVIKKYYDFYVQNGRFASSKLFENKIEKQIANDYESLNYSEKYYNKNAIYYNNIINDIKKKRKNRSNLLKIKKYINFCKLYLRMPVHNSTDLKNDFKRLENRIVINFEKINLEEVVVPYYLLEELYETISMINENNDKIKKDDLKTLFEKIISYMEENSYSCWNDNTTRLNYKDKTITCQSAMDIINSNINYLDDDLIEKYNSFNFIRKKLNK